MTPTEQETRDEQAAMEWFKNRDKYLPVCPTDGFLAGVTYARANPIKAENDRLREALERVSRLLDTHIASIPCNASVYELDDDQFGWIMHCRDLADLALEPS